MAAGKKVRITHKEEAKGEKAKRRKGRFVQFNLNALIFDPLMVAQAPQTVRSRFQSRYHMQRGRRNTPKTAKRRYS